MKSLRSQLISILRWSERYTKTDMVYLASGGMWLGVAQLSASVAAFVLTVVLANVLSQETLGEYRFLMAALMILSAFALPGMRSAIIESTPKGFRGNLSVGYRETRQWALIGSAGAILCSIYYFLNNDFSLVLGFITIAIALPWLDASSLYNEFLKALHKFNLIALSTTVTRGILMISVVGAAFFAPHSAWLILAVFLAATIIPNSIFHRKTIDIFTSRKDESDPGLISYAKHLSVMAGLALLAVQVDKIFIWHFLGAEQLALFFIAFAIPQEVIRFLAIIPALALPKFATGNILAIRSTLLPKLLLFLVSISFCVGLYVLSAPIIFSYIFPEYMTAVPYSQVLILAALASAFFPISVYFTAHKYTNILYKIAVFTAITRVTASFFLVAYFGLWGAVYAIIIEAVFSALCYVFFFLRTRHSQSKE